MWHVYIVQCADDTLYTGTTTDLSRRLNEHNSGKGGNYTRCRNPVKLLYKEPQPDRSEALKREARIKSWTKKTKLALINGDIPKPDK